MPAGYSGTPLAAKLGIKNGQKVCLIDAPSDFEQVLAGLPADAEVIRRGSPRGCDVTVAFFVNRREFESAFRKFTLELAANGSLWIAWPKKSSRVSTDITEDVVREVALPTGLVDNKVCAIDDTWSGLRLVVRTENRPGWPSSVL